MRSSTSGDKRSTWRWALIPLSFLFGLIGTILMLYGAISLFQQDGPSVHARGLDSVLAPFVDCRFRADLATNTTFGGQTGSGSPALEEPQPGVEEPAKAKAGGGAGGKKEMQQAPPEQQEEIREQGPRGQFRDTMEQICNAEQRPFLYLFCLAAVMTFLANLISLLMLFKSPRGGLVWLAIHIATTLSLLFLSIYAMMRITQNLYRIQNCQGYDQAAIEALKQRGVACYHEEREARGTDWEDVPGLIFDNILPCFWVGVAFNIISMGLLSLLPAALWYYKNRKRVVEPGMDRGYGYGHDATARPTVGERIAGATQGAHTGAPTTGREYYYSEADRHRAVPPTV